MLFALSMLFACEPEPPPEPVVPENCKHVHLDKLAHDWIIAKGDPKSRARITEQGSGYRMRWVSGGALPVVFEGEKREKDVQFTEVPRGKRKKLFNKGELALVRIYAKPHLKKCAVEMIVGRVDKSGKESVPVKGTEFVQFPKEKSKDFNFRPPTEDLFLGPAAEKPKVAKKQIEEMGEPQPDHPFGKIPVGMWSDPAKDGGDESCSFEMDLWLDGQKTEHTGIHAKKVGPNGRRWFMEWDVPYSGNHTLEFHRYRTCGGEREFIAVAAIEAVLT